MTPDRNIPVGTRFRMAREDRGLSQQDLADKSCVSRNTISNLERCNDIKLSTLLELSVRLGVAPHLWLVPDADWLFWHYQIVGAAPRPAPLAVEVQPPEHVREHVAMMLEGDFTTDELRFVVYNDAARGEWLQRGKCYCGCNACKYCEQLLEVTP